MNAPARHIFMVTPRFIERVRAGVKRCTIRPRRSRMPKAGDIADLRAWSGMPYRSKQIRLRERPIIGVREFEIQDSGDFRVDGHLYGWNARNALARRDGFDSAEDLIAWFKETHGELPFVGFLTEWAS